MYSLTFCIRVMSPERHHWKPTVQATAVMLRTPASHRPASHAHLRYMARNVENSSVTCWSLISNARTPHKLGFALCCHSNATGAPIANPPNSAQLRGSLYRAPKLHPGPCSSVGVRPRTDTHRDTQTRVTTIHFASSTTHAKCNNNRVHL